MTADMGPDDETEFSTTVWEKAPFFCLLRVAQGRGLIDSEMRFARETAAP